VKRTVIACEILLVLLVVGGVGQRWLRTAAEPVPCKASAPSGDLSTLVPEWEIAPRMLFWEHTPNDQPYPATNVSYEMRVTNTGNTHARNVHVYLGSQLFGWQEMAFDYGKTAAHLTCPELSPGQHRSWRWGHTWKKPADPTWRQSMEQSAELRFVWQDEAGWHEVKGKLPSQYAPAAYEAKALR